MIDGCPVTITGALLNKLSRHVAAIIWSIYIPHSLQVCSLMSCEAKFQFKIGHACLDKKWSWFTPIYYICHTYLLHLSHLFITPGSSFWSRFISYITRQRSSISYFTDTIRSPVNKTSESCASVCTSVACVCTRTWMWTVGYKSSYFLFSKRSQSSSRLILTLRTSDAGIPALRKLPCGVGSRYTGGTVCQRQASDVGIPAFFTTADWHRHAWVIEIQTRQQLKNTCSHETQRIFMNKFCIWTPSGQRTCYVQRFFKVTCLCGIFESTFAIFVWRSLRNFANCAHGKLRGKRWRDGRDD